MGMRLSRAPLAQHLQPLLALAGVIGRGVEIDQQLRAGLGRPRHRPRQPDILADGHADPHPGHRHHRRGLARHEVALLVEHAVIRQPLLVIRRPHRAAVQHHGGVAQAFRRRQGAADNGGDAPNPVAQPLQRGLHLGDEAGTQQQILRRIAGDGEFREDDQIGPQAVAGFGGGGDNLVGIALNIADQEIELGHDDPEEGETGSFMAEGLSIHGQSTGGNSAAGTSVKRTGALARPLPIRSGSRSDVNRGKTPSSPRRCRPGSGRSWRPPLPAPRTCLSPCPCRP